MIDLDGFIYQNMISQVIRDTLDIKVPRLGGRTSIPLYQTNPSRPPPLTCFFLLKRQCSAKLCFIWRNCSKPNQVDLLPFKVFFYWNTSVPPSYVLFGGTVPPSYVLFAELIRQVTFYLVELYRQIAFLFVL